jgi:hypothetical protein
MNLKRTLTNRDTCGLISAEINIKIINLRPTREIAGTVWLATVFVMKMNPLNLEKKRSFFLEKFVINFIMKITKLTFVQFNLLRGQVSQNFF